MHGPYSTKLQYMRESLPYCLICYPASITLVKAVLIGSFQLACCGNGGPDTPAGLNSFFVVHGVSTGLGSVMKNNTCI